MTSKAAQDPVAQARQLIAEARQAFARDVDEILGDISLGLHREVILEKFDQYLPMQSLADPVLLQLVREAYDHFEDPESRVNIADWVRTAKPLVTGEGR